MVDPSDTDSTAELVSNTQFKKYLIVFSLALGLAFIFNSNYNAEFQALNFHIPALIAATVSALLGALGYWQGVKVAGTSPGQVRSAINGIFSFVMADLLCDFFGLYEVSAFIIFPLIALSSFVTGWRLTGSLFD